MIQRLLAVCLPVLLLAACGSDNDPTRPNDFVPLTGITVTSENPRIALGTSNRFTAVGDYSGAFQRDITAEVTWSADPPTVLTFNQDVPGLATSQTADSVSVTASLEGIEGTLSDFSVVAATIEAIALAPIVVELPLGRSEQMTATGTFTDGGGQFTQDITRDVTWTVSDDAAVGPIATISGTGLVTTVAVGGPVDLTASFGPATASVSLTVTAAALERIDIAPADPVLAEGESQQFTATAVFSDGSTEVVTDLATWSSSATAVATIATTGLATAVGSGTTTITAEHQGVQGTVELTVATLEAIEVTAAAQVIRIDETTQLTATGSFSNGPEREITTGVTWRSDNSNIASVNSSGVVRGERIGSTIIRAEQDNIEGSIVITVTQ